MLTSQTCITATCDGCRDIATIDEETAAHFDSDDAARDYLRGEGWGFINNRLLCPDCRALCERGEHQWRTLTAQPGVFGDAQQFPLPFQACCRCELLRLIVEELTP